MLSIQMSPPCARAIWRAMKRPRPSPLTARGSAARSNGSNTSALLSSRIPRPAAPDDDPRAAAAPRHGEGDGTAAAVLHRVGEQVRHHLVEAIGIPVPGAVGRGGGIEAGARAVH